MQFDNELLKGQSTLQKVDDLMDRVDDVIPRWPVLYRNSRGKRIYEILDEMECLCIAANKKYFKKTTLQDLDIKNAQLRNLFRRTARTSYTDKKGNKRMLITPGQHAEWAGFCVEIGKMIGGWMGSLNERGNAVKADKQP